MSNTLALIGVSPRQSSFAKARALRVEIADDVVLVSSRWAALRDEGSALAFQGETWLSAWYANLGADAGAEPVLATLVDEVTNADLLALPLVRRTARGLVTIEFADGGLTDYNAPIMSARGVAIAPSDLMKALRAALPRADILRFSKMPERVGALANPLASLAGARSCRLDGNIIRAPEVWDDWHWGLERTFRKELERSWRVFERRGGVFRRVVDIDDARRVFADLKRLQRARIDDLGYEYTLDEPRNEAFYDEILERGLATGDVILTTLEANGEMVAGLLSIAKGDHYSMTRLAAAGGEWKNVSPGRLIIERTMKHLHGEGFRIFDFTIGDYAYKRRLGVEKVPLFDYEAALSWRGIPSVMMARTRAAARENPRVVAAVQWLRRMRRSR